MGSWQTDSPINSSVISTVVTSVFRNQSEVPGTILCLGEVRGKVECEKSLFFEVPGSSTILEEL